MKTAVTLVAHAKADIRGLDGSFLRHLRNEPGHNRNEDDRQDYNDRHGSSAPGAVRFGLAGLRQGFGQAPPLGVEQQNAHAWRLFYGGGRGGLRLLSQPERPAFDRLEKSAPYALCSSFPFHSHLILRK
jgi:hypothetical protein